MKKRVVSGIKPSGDLHIGNYLGAIAQWVKLQDDFDMMVFVADLHAITVPQDPKELRRRTIEIVKIYMAAGLDTSQVTIFAQSQIHEHAELCWILNTITRNGDLTKMTQFKDKSGFDIDLFDREMEEFMLNQKQQEELVNNSLANIKEDLSSKNKQFDINKLNEESLFRALGIGLKHGIKVASSVAKKFFIIAVKERFNSVGVGLFDYPVLMAGDIMLYDADLVPVGDDQVQHIELARTIGRRFNKRFGDIFKMPRPLLQKEGARIMALDNPSKKMSKSAASENGYIALNDDPERARKKIMKAVTDSGTEIVFSDEKPALKNLITIHALFSGVTTSEIEAMYAGKGYAEFKTGLAGVVVAFLEDFQIKYAAISDEDVMETLRKGAEKARTLAQKKILEVKESVGFLV